ncbi:AbrB family transcriptional regulator [Scytonema hofmannii PCC 7110]|uniref:AbrB family transcriptional regulator n=1 Tax=Scytonema hofmannii PCC 7110 TaxID=128403 RepID=A0A139XB29_9CYAN|nr:AbrB family transcriptional regulator [Scytonema hofmannii]KYC41889.1 AbrB family transcriptional regulator [Scytonema hofmannii PCC 7110]
MNQSLTVADRQQISSETQSVLTKQQIPGKQLIILVLEMLLALPLGILLAKFHIGGVAWIFGGIISGAIVLQTDRILYKNTPKPNRVARKTGMALVGLNVGFSISHGHLTNVVSSIPVFAFLTFFLLFCGIFIGYVYSRLSKTNLLTALLATVPGGVGMMSAIAADYNRNVPLVAMVQAIRVTTVVFLLPLIARILSGNQISSQTFPVSATLLNLEPSQLGLLLASLLFGILGVYIAILCKMPAGEFFGAIVAGVAFNPILTLFGSSIDYALPPMVNIVGQMLLGITIGEYWGDKPTLGKKTIAYAFVSVAMTLLTGIAATILAMQLTSWDWLTCLLVTAPGGSAEMILVALALHHNVEIVTGGHLVRLVAINSSLPVWLYLFERLDNKLVSG